MACCYQVTIFIIDTAVIILNNRINCCLIHTCYTSYRSIDFTVCWCNCYVNRILKQSITIICCDFCHAICICFQTINNNLSIFCRNKSCSRIFINSLSSHIPYSRIFLRLYRIYIISICCIVKFECNLAHIPGIIRELFCQVKAVSIYIVPVFQCIVVTVRCTAPCQHNIVLITFITKYQRSITVYSNRIVNNHVQVAVAVVADFSAALSSDIISITAFSIQLCKTQFSQFYSQLGRTIFPFDITIGCCNIYIHKLRIISRSQIPLIHCICRIVCICICRIVIECNLYVLIVRQTCGKHVLERIL